MPAAQTYYEPTRPLIAEQAGPDTDRPSELLDASDVLGKRIVDTRLQPKITIRAENTAAALEVMSRFAIDPRWLIYLPPTMTPTATSDRPGLLEHPAGAFAAYRRDGVTKLICEEKHMGSRAVAIVDRDADVAARRFRIEEPAGGVIYTRTGRAFLADPKWQADLVDRLRSAITDAGLWDELDTDWMALDTELLPWSAKAGDSCAPSTAPSVPQVGPLWGGPRSCSPPPLTEGSTSPTSRRGPTSGPVSQFIDAYGRYCWPVESVDDLQITPFVVLAIEGSLQAGRSHQWHTTVADRLAQASPETVASTRHILVDLDDPASETAATEWWEDLVASGSEGMVVKPLDSVITGDRGLVQPGIKCRGPEYLRIVYGPEYRMLANQERLRDRNLGRKRSLAQREFALGIEALERFVAHEPSTGSTNASSESSPSRANPSTPRL